MAVYVTDTHPLVWYATGRHRQLSAKALRAYRAADSGRAQILVPAVVFWEISILEKIGRIRLSQPFTQWAETLLLQNGFDLASFRLSDIGEAAKFNINDDIFDAAIVAAASTRDLPLITRDEGVTESGIVDVFW